MIEGVQVVSAPVSDQDRAKSFYADTLGFELRAENTFGEGMRWIEVADVRDLAQRRQRCVCPSPSEGTS